MAVTGIVFGLFVLMHMIGNLKAYLGPQHFDDYAMWLRHLAEPLVPYSGVLWALRVVLLACLVALLVPLGSPAILGSWSHVLFLIAGVNVIAVVVVVAVLRPAESRQHHAEKPGAEPLPA